MKKYIAEFIGTFALVFFGTGSIIVDQVTNGGVSHVGIAITFGLIVMTMIYGLAEISGAHINPAVSISFAIAGRLPVKLLAPYVTSQVAGAFLASIVLRLLFPTNQFLGSTIPTGPPEQ